MPDTKAYRAAREGKICASQPDRRHNVRGAASAALIAVALIAPGCIPTAARTNARLQPGIDVYAVGGVQVLPEGTDQNGEQTDSTGTAHIEIGLQYATEVGDGGLALQAKVPAIYIYSSLDFYYQLPPIGTDFYAGLGAELGIAPSVYAVMTKYLTPSFYLTFTPRLLYQGVNPQLAIGFLGHVDFAILVSYLRFFGDGLDIDIDFSSDENDEDLRTDAFLLAGALRF